MAMFTGVAVLHVTILSLPYTYKIITDSVMLLELATNNGLFKQFTIYHIINTKHWQ